MQQSVPSMIHVLCQRIEPSENLINLFFKWNQKITAGKMTSFQNNSKISTTERKLRPYDRHQNCIYIVKLVKLCL